MSKDKKQSDDDFDEDDKDQFIGKDENGMFEQANINGSGKGLGGKMGFGDGGFGMGMGGSAFGGIGGGMGAGLGGMGSMGGMRGFGGGFGGGLGGFGSHMGHDMNGHSHNDILPREVRQSNNPFQGDNIYAAAKGVGKTQPPQQVQQKKEPQQSQQQKLARLTKKQDIPQQQQLTLVDWSIRGQAEIVRMVMEYILIPYKQKKYTFLTKDKWEKQDYPELQKKHPAIQLPYLQDGEKIICGTQAMIVYILHKYNRTELLGVSAQDKVKTATAASMYWELIEDYLELCYGEYEEDITWERAREKYVNQRFRVQLNKIVTFLRHKLQGSPELNWVDFGIAEIVTILNQMDYRFKDHNIQVQNYINKVLSLPQFIVYRRSTRFHERPYNGFGALFK